MGTLRPLPHNTDIMLRVQNTILFIQTNVSRKRAL
jgi:hypothetical protein